MTPNLIVATPILVILCLLIWLRLPGARNTAKGDPPTTVTALNEIREILAPSKRAVSLSVLLQSRAIPNQRLRRAFHINNTFVSADPHVHSRFVADARRLLSEFSSRESERRWSEFREVTSHLVNSYLRGPTIPYDVFAQTITFGVIVVTLLDAEVSELEFESVAIVTKAINDLWCLSKTAAEGDVTHTLLLDINTHLHRWIPKYDNPLEFILPAFETLWRVVAAALPHVYADPDITGRAFADFFDNPVEAQFECFLNDRPSVRAVMQETLRLYPPTKRIKRSIKRFALTPIVPTFVRNTFPNFFDKTVVADVESLQRSDVWDASHTFDPMRHSEGRVTAESQRTLLGFGYGRLACIGRTWAPRAAALIVAAILEGLDSVNGERYVLIRGDEMGGREGWKGWEFRLVAKDEGVSCYR
ncbi:hypothetical protein JAAARDRAFT_127208 [Jaapia argillacea MUCL 33604]|uniref:Cytochrome P450 n=1 Tax=Jaapia argillacea MUCL 33604 TaxID=933084 RepID=A0A067PYA2_9AGAM|nr:hypothetical protein JAAARDRAFT_127208 [Jaapia argillacea MUCL 33604]